MLVTASLVPQLDLLEIELNLSREVKVSLLLQGIHSHCNLLSQVIEGIDLVLQFK